MKTSIKIHALTLLQGSAKSLFSAILVFGFSLMPMIGFASQTFPSHSLEVNLRSPIVSGSMIVRPDFKPIADSGRITSYTQFEIINYISANLGSEQGFYIDGETWRFSQHTSYALDKHNEIAVEVPWLMHGEGISDRFIYKFHDILQLPQNGRTKNRHNKMLWSLRHKGESLVSLRSPTEGLGDIRLTWRSRLSLPTATQFAVRIKLPTGEFDKQTGSEKFDFGISLAQQNPTAFKQRSWLADTPLSLWYGAGLSYIQTNEALDKLDSKDFSLSVRAGIAWKISDNWQIKSQLDANTPIFDSSVRELGWIPVQIGIASEHALSTKTSLELMIIEDLRPRTSPDVIFSSGLRIHF